MSDEPTASLAPEQAQEFYVDLIGRLFALEELTIALLASHARMHDGFAREIINDPDCASEILGKIDFGSSGALPDGFLTKAKAQAQAIADYANSAKSMIGSWRERYGP